MAKVAKRTAVARQAFVGKDLISVEDAVALIKSAASAKFDETLEIAMNLGVDPRHADQMVRGVVTLPNGTGKTVRVAVFARGAKADEAKPAGADIVGAVDAAKGGTVQVKAEKAGVIHAGIGKISFADDALAQNVRAFVDAVSRAKPAGAKGAYLKKVSLSSTMGPGVSLDLSSATAN